MAYAFFLSYASADARNGGGAVEWFFTKLAERLNVVHGEENVGDGGYFAALAIREGADWRGRELPRALNTSHVLVCLQSPNYFNSQYCGKELDVFLRRRQQFILERGGTAPDCVIPVVWQPSVRPRPRALPDFQWKKPDGTQFPAEITGLFEAYDRHRELGNAFIQQLAKRISNFLLINVGDSELPPLPDPPDIDGLESVFRTSTLPLPDLDSVCASGLRAVTFVYPSNVQPHQWPFAPPPENAAVVHAAAIARSRELNVQGIEFGPSSSDVVERIKRAQQLKTPIVLLLTQSTLGNAALVEQLSSVEPTGIAIVVVDRTGGAVAPNLLGRLRGAGRFHVGLKTSDMLDDAIRKSLATLRQALRQNGRTDIDGSGPDSLPSL